MGGGSAFGGGPIYRGGSSRSRRSSGSGSRADPFRDSAKSRKTPDNRLTGRGEVPSERQLAAIEREGFNREEFIPRRETPEIVTGRRRVPVTPGFARRTQTLSEQGEFDRVERQARDEQVAEFASATRTGGASFATGSRAVTPTGEDVGLVSTPDGARLVTPSGRDVTPTRIDRRGTVSPGRQRGFLSGLRQGVFDPLGGLPVVTPRGGVLQTTVPSTPELAGQIVGAPLGFIATRGAGRVVGVGGRRVFSAVAARSPRAANFISRVGTPAMFVAGAGGAVVEAQRIQELPPGIERLSRAASTTSLSTGFSIGVSRGVRAPFTRLTGAAERSSITRISTRSGFREVSLSAQPAERVTQGFLGEVVESGEVVSRSVSRGTSISNQLRQGYFVSSQAISQPRFSSQSVNQFLPDGTLRIGRPSQVVSGRGFLDSGSGIAAINTFDRGLAFSGLAIDTIPRVSRGGRRVSQTTALSFPRQGDALMATQISSLRANARQGFFGRSVTGQRFEISPGRAFSELEAFGFNRGGTTTDFDVRLPRLGRRGSLGGTSQRLLRVNRNTVPPSRSPRLVDDDLFEAGAGLRLESVGRAVRIPRTRLFTGGLLSRGRDRSISNVSSGLLSSTFQDVSASTRSLLGNRSLTVPRQSFDLRSGLRQQQSVLTGLQTSISRTTTPFTPTFPSFPKTPKTPGFAPPVIPGFNLPDFGVTGLSRAPGRGNRRSRGFTPSLVAGFFDITGSPSRTTDLTGLELRPINFNKL